MWISRNLSLLLFESSLLDLEQLSCYRSRDRVQKLSKTEIMYIILKFVWYKLRFNYTQCRINGKLPLKLLLHSHNNAHLFKVLLSLSLSLWTFLLTSIIRYLPSNKNLIPKIKIVDRPKFFIVQKIFSKHFYYPLIFVFTVTKFLSQRRIIDFSLFKKSVNAKFGKLLIDQNFSLLKKFWFLLNISIVTKF